MEDISVALLQMAPHGNDQHANLLKADKVCRKAARLGADIALMPEMWNTGYAGLEGTDPKDRRAWQDQAVPRDGEWVGHFRMLAAELTMAIGVTYLETWPQAPRNTISLVDSRGEIVLTYAKVHTCDFSNAESATTPGDAWPVHTLTTARGQVAVGTMICYDREFPESARCLMLGGAELIMTPNACVLDEIKISQFRCRAVENAVAVAMTNYPAPVNNGNSVAFGADGAMLAQSGETETCVSAAARRSGATPSGDPIATGRCRSIATYPCSAGRTGTATASIQAKGRLL
jgi:N-carbamoylputrescine amidase